MGAKNVSEHQTALLKQAQEAANTGDVLTFVEKLFQCGILEAFTKRFNQRYGNLDIEDVDTMVAKATDDLCAKIEAGKKILDIKNYLWRSTEFHLIKLNREVVSKQGDIERTGYTEVTVSTDSEKEAFDIWGKEILHQAERLIPQIVPENAQKVMRYIFGAMRNGADNISPAEIAEALHMDYDLAYQSRKRGFERLLTLLKENNLVDEDYTLPILTETRYHQESVSEDDET